VQDLKIWIFFTSLPIQFQLNLNTNTERLKSLISLCVCCNLIRGLNCQFSTISYISCNFLMHILYDRAHHRVTLCFWVANDPWWRFWPSVFISNNTLMQSPSRIVSGPYLVLSSRSWYPLLPTFPVSYFEHEILFQSICSCDLPKDASVWRRILVRRW